MEWATPGEAPRTSFVTVVAWIYIAMSGLGVFVLVIELILFNTVIPLDQMHEAWMKAQRDLQFPAIFGWFFDHLRFFFSVFLALALFKLISAIALLQRRNWARLVFIGIFALGILWNVVGTVLQQFSVSWVPTIPHPQNAPADFDLVMTAMMTWIRIVSAFFAIAFTVLFAWLIKKLLSPPIVAEFR